MQPLVMSFHPPRNKAGNMHGMLVYDQKDFALGMANQTSKKYHKNGCIESSLKDHEGQLPPIGDRRDHVAAKALARPRNHRGLPTPTPASSGLVVGTHSRLVAPKNRCALPLGSGTDRRVFFLHPLAHFHRVLLVSAPDGFLRRKTPAPKISPYRPNRQPYSEFANHQVAHSLASPKRKRHLDLIRTSVGDHPHHRRRLMWLETIDRRAAALARPQCIQSTFAVAVHPQVNRLLADSQQARHLCLGLSRQHGTDRTLPQNLLGRRRQRSRIRVIHAWIIAYLK